MLALQSDLVTDSIGMNVKPEDFGRSYDMFWDSVIMPQLAAAGIRHTRVGIAPGVGLSAPHKATYYARLAAMGAAGVSLTCVTVDLNVFFTVATNAVTAAGNPTLHFAGGVGGIDTTTVINDNDTPSAIAAGTNVLTFTSTSITMDANATGPGVGSGDTIALHTAYNLGNLSSDYASGGNAMTFVEAMNEPNLFSGLPGQTPTEAWYDISNAYQQSLWAAVQANSTIGPSGANVQVCGPGLTGGGWSPLGDISAFCNFGNIHPYNNGGNPEAAIAAAYLTNAAVVYGSLPVIATEIGYTQSLSQHAIAAASVDIITRYLPRMFLYNLGVLGMPRSYVYQMMADRAPDATDPQAGYGLINNDGTLTAMWSAVSNLSNMFSDPGAPFTPAALSCSISGGTGALQSLLFQKRDGSYLLAVWVGSSGWNATTYAPITVTPQSVTITLPANKVTKNVFNDDGTLTTTTVPVVSRTLALTAADTLTVLEFKVAADVDMSSQAIMVGQ